MTRPPFPAAAATLLWLMVLASCGTRGASPSPDTPPMDADFEPSEPHPWACRTEQGSGQQLTARDLTAHGDTLGPLVITRTDGTGADDVPLRTFAFSHATLGPGSASCAYDDFAELTDLWVETATRRSHSTLLWDERGNLVSLNQETWTTLGADSTRHEVQVIEYQYGDHTAYGNWYASQAETVGGPVATALHAGLMGRAPWTLPVACASVTSVISRGMVVRQEAGRGSFGYAFDHNGRVVTERQQLDGRQHTYGYTYP